MYITMVEFGGHPKIFSFMQFSQKIDGFRQNIHRAFRTHTSLFKQNPSETFFILNIYQNNTLALSYLGTLFISIPD